MLSDNQRLTELVAAANNASGASNEQYNKTLESLQTKLTELKNSWDEFMMSIANSEAIKGAVDGVNSLIKGANQFFDTVSFGNSSLKTFEVLLSSLALFKGGKMLTASIGLTSDNFVTSIKNFINERKNKAKVQVDEEETVNEEFNNTFEIKINGAGEDFKSKVEEAATQFSNTIQNSATEKTTTKQQNAEQQADHQAQETEKEKQTEIEIEQERLKKEQNDQIKEQTIAIKENRIANEEHKQQVLSDSQAVQEGAQKNEEEALASDEAKNADIREANASNVAQSTNGSSQNPAPKTKATNPLNIVLSALKAGLVAATLSSAVNEQFENTLQNNYDTNTEKIETLTNSIDDLTERQSDISSQMSSFSQTRAELLNLNSNLKNMSVGSMDWFTAMQQNNEKIDSLVASYSELQQYVSTDQNGVKSLSGAGWTAYEDQLKNDAENLIIQKQIMQIEKSRLEQSEKINDVIDTSTVTQSELDQGANTRRAVSVGLGAAAGVGTAAGIGIAAATGALAGSFIPVLGTAIGALAGVLVGGITAAIMSSAAEVKQSAGVDEALLTSSMEQISLGNDEIISKLQALADLQEQSGNTNEKFLDELAATREAMLEQGYSSDVVDSILNSIQENGQNTVDAIYAAGEAYSSRNSQQFQAGLEEARRNGLEGAEAIQYALAYQNNFEETFENYKNQNDIYKAIVRRLQDEDSDWRATQKDFSDSQQNAYIRQAYDYYQKNHGYTITNSWFYKDGIEVEQGEIYVQDVIDEYQNYIASIENAKKTMDEVSEGNLDYAGMLKQAKIENIPIPTSGLTVEDLRNFQNAFVLNREQLPDNQVASNNVLGVAQKTSKANFKLIETVLKEGYEGILNETESTFDITKKVFEDVSREYAPSSFVTNATNIQDLEKYYNTIANENIRNKIDQGIAEAFTVNIDKVNDLLDYSYDNLGQQFNVSDETLDQVTDTFEEGSKVGLDEAINYIEKRKRITGLFGSAGETFVGYIEKAINSGQIQGELANQALTSLIDIDVSSPKGFDTWLKDNEKLIQQIPGLNDVTSDLKTAFDTLIRIPGAISLLNLDETAEGISTLAESLKTLRESVDDFIEFTQEEMLSFVERGLSRSDFALTRSGKYIYTGDRKDLANVTQKTAENQYHLYNESQEFLREIQRDFLNNDGGVYDVQKSLESRLGYDKSFAEQIAKDAVTMADNLSKEGYELQAQDISQNKLQNLFDSDFAERFGVTRESFRNATIIDNNGNITWQDNEEAEKFKNNYTHFVNFLAEIQNKTAENLDDNIKIAQQQYYVLKTPQEFQNELASTADSQISNDVVEQTLKQMASEHEGLWNQILSQLNIEDFSNATKVQQIQAAQMIAAQDRDVQRTSLQNAIKSQADDFIVYAKEGTQSEAFTQAVSQAVGYAQQIGLDWDAEFIKAHAEQLANWATNADNSVESIQSVLKDQAIKAVEAKEGNKYTEKLQSALAGLNEDILTDLAQWKDGEDLTDNTQTFITSLMSALEYNVGAINQAFAQIGTSLNITRLNRSPLENEKAFDVYTYNGKSYNNKKEFEDDTGYTVGTTEYNRAVWKGDIKVETYAVNSLIGKSQSSVDWNEEQRKKNATEETNYSSWENPYDLQYNLLKKIEHEQENRNRLETEYNSLQKAGVKTSSEYARNLEQQQTSLAKERAQQQQLLQNRRSEIALINQEYAGQQVNGRDITSFVSWDENGTLQIDWSGIQTLESLTENLTDEQVKERELLTKYIDEIETTYESIEETTSTIKDIDEQQLELAETQQKAAADLADKVQQGLTQQRQDEIDRLSKVSEAISTSNSKLLDSIRSSIDKMRQDRENAETAEELDEKRRRLAYLQLDTSGASDNQIRQLQEEIKDQEQSYRDSLVDQKIDELEEQNQFAEDQRQMQIELLQQQLEQMQNNPDLQAIQRIIAEGLSGNKNIVEGSQLDQLLKLAEGWKTQTSVEKQNQIEQSNAQLVGEQNANVSGGNASTSARTSSSTVSSGGASSEIKSEQAALVASYGKQLGPKDEGYNNDKQAVKNLQNALNDITSAGLDVDGSFGEKTANAVKNFQSWQGLGVDGHVGAKTRAAFKKFQQYKTGGAVYDTGIAWLDGTPSRPEYVLNAAETQNFFALRDILSESMRNGAFTTQKSGDVYYQIDLKVEGGISSDYDVDRIISKVKSEIVSSQRSRNANAIALGR